MSVAALIATLAAQAPIDVVGQVQKWCLVQGSFRRSSAVWTLAESVSRVRSVIGGL